MAGESFQQLLDLGKTGKHTAVEGVSLNKDIADAQAQAEEDKLFAAHRANEQAINKKVAASIAQDKENKAKFGTSDPKQVAAIVAAGGFEAGDIAKQMEIDPEGTRASVEKRILMAGRGGPQELPDAPQRQFRRGVGEGGEPYFTNLSDAELTQEKSASQAIRTPLDIEDKGTGVKDLQPFEPGTTGGVSGGSEGAPQDKALEDILFQGKIDQARAITEKPQREDEHAVAKSKFFDKIWNKEEDISGVSASLMDALESGEARKAGLNAKDIQQLDAIAKKRGKKQIDIAKGGLDPKMFKPWLKAQKRPGEGEDISEPSSVLNPGGGPAETTKAKMREGMASNNAAMNIEETMPAEPTTAYQYAKGKVAKKAGTKQVARGGKGGSVLSDIGGFLEGEGRAGYGESGPVGVAKDLAAFYGPRLPGDIMTALGGVGAKNMLKKGAKSAMGIRAIENMFGKF